ncbi:unnamed protein product [Symbiodinium natans]|uniref:Uncharacterized protein n=1 Tax=Symbiodinium natans TaxID=878477 RepID=A0A812R8R3_9DINO|nr:unnamed protein product [Symbiodinium natans]
MGAASPLISRHMNLYERLIRPRMTPSFRIYGRGNTSRKCKTTSTLGISSPRLWFSSGARSTQGLQFAVSIETAFSRLHPMSLAKEIRALRRAVKALRKQLGTLLAFNGKEKVKKAKKAAADLKRADVEAPCAKEDVPTVAAADSEAAGLSGAAAQDGPDWFLRYAASSAAEHAVSLDGSTLLGMTIKVVLCNAEDKRARSEGPRAPEDAKAHAEEFGGCTVASTLVHCPHRALASN